MRIRDADRSREHARESRRPDGSSPQGIMKAMTPRRWIEYSAAILLGNAIYFLLYPSLPPSAQHQPFRFGQPFRVDLGLLLDLAICVAVYATIRLAVAHARRWNTRRG